MSHGVFGLLGEHLLHSRSPQIHEKLGDYEYRLFPTPPQELASFLRSDSFQGLNVTIPYKEAVLPYCKTLSDTARRLGCVNTIIRNEDGSLHGDNTDYYGFRYLLSRAVNANVGKACLENTPALSGKKALVLGSGGASKTVRAALSDVGCREVVVISRSGENNYQNLSRHADADFLVNTTPVGMFPDNGSAPLSLKQFPKLCGVVDLIYNPLRTALLLEAKALEIPYENGLSMLVAQAARASSLFMGASVDDCDRDATFSTQQLVLHKSIQNCEKDMAEKIERILQSMTASETNLVLIGMPGSGKSTLGRRLANELHREFLDTDEMIFNKTGRFPADIIKSDGEDAFRRIESQILKKAGATTGAVIATGGGVVTREENYNVLSQNGTLIFLHRAPDKLSTKGRPLSSDRASVLRLYEKRLELYRRFCDVELFVPESVERAYLALLDFTSVTC